MKKHEMIDINDFKIILNHMPDAKTTMVEAYISSGYINENEENEGISHLLEHVLIDSWDKCGKLGCSDYWKKKGVLTNASTGQTTVQYYIHGLAKDHIEMIDYITSITLKPKISKFLIKKEAKAVFNELLIHAAHPMMDLYHLLNNMLFRLSGLQLQDDIKLQIKNLKTFNVDNLNSWIKKFYGSGNIIFVISGKYTKKKVLSLLKKNLTKVNPIKIIPKYSDIFKPGLDIQFLKNNKIDNTNILLAFHSPIYQKDPEIFYIDFFKEFIGSGVTSFIMSELREKKNLIYNVTVDNYTTPYGTYLTIEISTKNKNIEDVVFGVIKILKNLVRGKFSHDYLKYVKKAYMIDHHSQCKNNEYFNDFYGQQYINQLYNPTEEMNILEPDEVTKNILGLEKLNFVLFLKKLIIFSNMKIAYQGKREVKNLQSLVLKRI